MGERDGAVENVARRNRVACPRRRVCVSTPACKDQAVVIRAVVMINPTFWTGRRVLLSGHTGFKGAWLALWLRKWGAHVAGLALPPPTDPSLYVAAAVDGDLTSFVADVRDAAAVREAVAAHRPEIVFHLAAQPLVRLSYADPVGTYATNVMGTVHVLDAVRAVGGVRVVVCVTSDKCYDNREWAWGYRENDALGGRDPYSNSKGCSELVAAAYRDSFLTDQKVALATARAGNVIGGGDWAEDRLVPDLMRAFAARRPAVIRNPTAIRPWQHVLEPLGAYLLLAERLWEQGAPLARGWNFGPDDADARPVWWVAQRLARAWGERASCEQAVTGEQQPHEARYLKLDCSLATAELSWRPTLSLAEALDWTVEWYKTFDCNPTQARQVTEEQIDRFLSLRAERSSLIETAQ